MGNDMKDVDYFLPVTLIGTKVRLEQLSAQHHDDLAPAGAYPEIWRWLPSAHSSEGSMATFIESNAAMHAAKKAVPFATIDIASGKAVGSTRFHYIEPENRRLEIGMTWITPAYQRSNVNSEAKYLQLWYAFEVLRCRRVEFKADAENKKSCNAILRLGAQQEGFFRKHMIYPNGRNRDSVYFAIIDDDWPRSKEHLLSRLGYSIEPRVLLKSENERGDL